MTNDLVTDQRADRTASLLASRGCKVWLVGRRLRGSPEVTKKNYLTKRLRLLFVRGFLFYAVFNLRIFIFLISRKRVDLIVANDLDTLTGCFIASRIRGTKIVYDSHEYFTEVPELVNRKFVRSIWKLLEKLIVPRLELAYTVNESIAAIYREKYGVPFQVVRNLPSLDAPAGPCTFSGLPVGEKKIVIYQGAVNIGRGIEQIIEAVRPMDDVVFVVAGSGDILDDIRRQVKDEQLEKKVFLTGRLTPDKLRALTPHAHLGVSVELNMGLNYYYALPNKLFAYIHAGIPVLASGFPEMKKIIDQYEVGMTVDDPQDIPQLREKIGLMLSDINLRKKWTGHARKASRELCWESEQNQLLNIYSKAGIPFKIT